MNKIVVTGAAGFIGSHLSHGLISNPNNYVLGIDNLRPAYGGNWSELRVAGLVNCNNFEFHELDLTSADPLRIAQLFEGAHSVIHLAAWPGVRTSQLAPHEYSKANLTGFGNVLEGIRLSKPRQFLFASSSSVYGDLGIVGPVHESSATGKNVKSYYAATKWANEVLAKSHSSITNVPTLALRFFTVFGEAGRPDMAYWTFLEKIKSGTPIDLYGPTGGSRNFTYVKDAVNILMRLIESEISAYSALNIAAGEPIDTLKFVETLSILAGAELKLNIVERPYVDVEKTWADLSELKRVIGEVIPTAPESGLQNFVDWYLTKVNE